MITEQEADVMIIGGSLGGCAAALAASKMGMSVIMTEETEWIGGQLTNQAVPPDEHRWIEQFGCTKSYRQLRERIRSYYREHFPLVPEALATERLNPGNGGVSRLCHDPRVALAVLQQMLAPYIHSGRLTVLTQYKAIQAEVDGDEVRSVTVSHVCSEQRIVLRAPFFLDATECGDVLPLAGVEYVTGSESQAQTGEPHALAGDPDPLDMQAITHCFAVDFMEGEDHTIDKPENYEFWRSYQADFWPDKQLSLMYSHPRTLEPTHLPLFGSEDEFSLWRYRRLIDRNNFVPETFDSDISLVNWPQNDYWLGPVFEVNDREREKHLQQAKQLSLSLLYWLQTEVPRSDGKYGYPELRLRRDVVGTDDGLAMYPYIRESRRIKAEFTVLEQHVSPVFQKDGRGEHFADSVGIGWYSIDLHPSTGGRNYIDVASCPFQIPLGSLIPIRMKNLIPACKNIGVTHITTGCYRLHPVEWNIGESAGFLAAYCHQQSLVPTQVRNDSESLEDFQRLLSKAGIERSWPKI